MWAAAVTMCTVQKVDATPLGGEGELEPVAYFNSELEGGSVTAQSPYALDFVNDGSGRFLIVRGYGIVTVHDADGSRSDPDKPLLDLTREVRFGGEGGMFSVTFDPEFPENRFFYLSYFSMEG